MRRVLLLAATLVLAGCSDGDVARQTVELYGFTDIAIGGYTPFGCADSDTFHTSFTARGVNGACVQGVVCSGAFKGATLRVTGPSNACPVRGPVAPQSGAR